MRRLLFLAGILLLVWAVLRHAATLEPLPGYVLRDTLLIVLAALGVTTGAARAYLPLRTTERAWRNTGRALFGAGAATALAGGLMAHFAPSTPVMAQVLWPIVWIVGLALAVVAVLLRGAVVRYAPPTMRWERDASGHIVGKPIVIPDASRALGRRGWVALVLLLAVAVALRVGLALRAPGYCLGSECDLLLAATVGAPRTTLILQPLAALLTPLLDDPLRALRLAGALVSSLALLALLPALRRLTSPGGVLLGAALAGWGAWAATPWPEAALFAPLVVWGACAGSNGGGARAWAAAGIALGLTAAAAPTVLGAWVAWLAVLLVVAATQPERGRGASISVLLLGALAGGALLATTASSLELLPVRPAFAALIAQAGALFAAILTPGALWLGAPVVVGVGAALRFGRRGAVLLSGGAAVMLWLLLLPEGASQWPLSVPFLLLAAALGADQLLRAAVRSGKPLVRGRAVTAGALAIALLVALPGLWRTVRAPQAQADAASSDMAQAVAAFITGARTQDEPSRAPLLLVPAALLDQAPLRLAAAPEIQAGRVQGFRLQSDLPFAGDAPDGIVYLIAVDDAAALEELARVYPAGVVAPAETDPALPALIGFTVSGAALDQSRGLLQFVTSGGSTGSATAGLTAGVGPLAFGWAARPPLPPPFEAEWRGSLLVRDRGNYTFSVEAVSGALFTLLLDGRLILDTSAGLTSFSDSLATGDYALAMRYQSGSSSGDLRVLWQPPGHEATPIPRAVLHNPPLPTLGLLGTYTGGGLWEGPLLTQRKDRVVQADPTLPTPWSVLWQGQLAAPRAGEYLIGAVSDGAVLIDVDGQSLVTWLPGADATESGDPAEGSLYLPGGWVPITVRYATGNQPGRAPELKLYWQPAGSGPAPLDAKYLYPSITPISAGDVPLPPLAAVVAARLGDESFALSGETSYWLPQTRIPARDLPPLNLERVGQFGTCGADITQLSAPHGLAWDVLHQTLYVADTGNGRVLALSRAANGALQPQLVPLPEMEAPVDVDVAPDGTLYVLDTAAPRLTEYDPASGAAGTIALGEGFYRPRGLAVAATGLLYIADTGGARVAVVELIAEDEAESTVVQMQFGGPGTPLGNGQPVDVAATPQAIWAIAAEHGRLWRMDTLGSLTAVRPTDTINGPHLAALEDGRLFVSDPARRLVLLLSTQGKPLAALADAGAFVQPTGVAAWRTDKDLLLAVSDTAACSVTLWQGAAP